MKGDFLCVCKKQKLDGDSPRIGEAAAIFSSKLLGGRKKGGRGVTVVLRGEQSSLWKMCSYINLYSSTTVQCALTAIYKFVKTLQFGVGLGGGIFSRLPERCAQLDKRGRRNCS